MGGRDRRIDAAARRLEAVEPRPTGRAVEPFTGTIIDAMNAAGLVGPSWDAWRTFWRAVFGLPMGEKDRELFAGHTARQEPPAQPVREAWVLVGRRGGKSRNAAVAAAFLAVRRDYMQLLAPGERGVIPVIAADRKQAGQVLRYLKGIVRSERFAPYVRRTLKESVEFLSGVTVEVHTASYRTTRGYTVVGLVLDELAFWLSDEGGANPDSEVLGALRPGMVTIEDALLLAISTPYAARGELYRAHARHFGQDDPRVLVWNADTHSMNAGVDDAVIAEAFSADPVAAASEYGSDGRVQFRADVQALFDVDALRGVTISGRRELPSVPGVLYRSFCDPSGGSQDSFTIAVAHTEGVKAVLDCVRETAPPFDPSTVVAEYVTLLRGYGVTEVSGDAYSGQWVREAFRRQGIEYCVSERNKSALYAELLPAVNSARVELLDHRKLLGQLAGLERRVARGGRDSIDHAPGGHDDVANAASGALVLAAAAGDGGPIFFATLDRAYPITVDPGATPPPPPWNQHCGREMRRIEGEDGDVLACVICGTTRPLDPPASTGIERRDESREWGEL